MTDPLCPPDDAPDAFNLGLIAYGTGEREHFTPLLDAIPAFTAPRGAISYATPDPNAPPAPPYKRPTQRGDRLLRWLARPRLRLRTRLARRWCRHPGMPEDNWCRWDCPTCGWSKRGEKDRWYDEEPEW